MILHWFAIFQILKRIVWTMVHLIEEPKHDRLQGQGLQSGYNKPNENDYILYGFAVVLDF